MGGQAIQESVCNTLQLGVTPSTHHMTNPCLVVLGNRNAKCLPTESNSLESRSYSLDKEILSDSDKQKKKKN